MRKPTERTALVTHKGCLDGTGCAAVFIWSGGLRKNVIFKTPNSCDLTPEEAEPFDEVWFADLCPKDMRDPAGGKPFWVCDHHLSNIERVGDHPCCTFSLTHSGTSLLVQETGIMFGPDGQPHDETEDLKTLIEALESYDLGRFDNVLGQRMADAAGSMSQEQMLLRILLKGTGVLSDLEIISRAEAMATARNMYAKRAAETAVYIEFRPPGWGLASGTVDAGIAISPETWKNQVAEEILRKAELAIVIDSTSWSLSFRSKTLDVSKMAQEYGGGGHKRAAGFKISSHDILRAVFQEIFG
jgi:oligoribonuclease NrnB/cAMP/cGMP phosphodiesterase (DHH superfamily)